MDNLPVGSVEATQLLKESMTQRLLSQSMVSRSFASIMLPAVPGMIDEYVTMCAKLAADIGGELSDEQRAHVRRRLKRRLAEARSASPYSTINIVLIAASGRPVQYKITAHGRTENPYAHSPNTPQSPRFGTEPDARVWALANEAADPAAHRVLDIGAGTGRNALPLARRGHPVDVVEMTPKFADAIRSDAEGEGLDVRVIVADVFSTIDDLRRDYQLILLSGVVSDFGTMQQLRGLFELAAHCLAPGARLVFNAFLVRPGYPLDQVAREFGQYFHTSFFTRDEMEAAAAELPLELVADDSVYDYEKAHLPHGAWPPTRWYADWVSGLNPFPVAREMSPIEMRWLVYQKTG
jgi:SAM-dependent methyltransferase